MIACAKPDTVLGSPCSTATPVSDTFAATVAALSPLARCSM
jgi:hypothetical protein